MASQEIDGWKEENPDDIDKVPVKASHFNSIRKLLRRRLPHLRPRPPEVGVEDETTNNVEGGTWP